MRVIDVDSHYFEPPGWLAQVDPELAAELPAPDATRSVVEFVVGNLMDSVPRDQLPDDPLELLAPSGRQAFIDAQTQIADESRSGESAPPPMSHEPSARIAFNDEVGIDVQFINPTFAGNVVDGARRMNRPDLTRRAIEGYNTWTAENLAGYTDRLMPTTMLDVTDIEWAVRELTRMRERGSRTFQLRAEPVGGTKSLAHPDMDPLWAAASDLEMAAVFHIGSARTDVDKGWYFNGGEPHNFALLHLVAGSMVPQIALAAMLIEGVFERHPNLVLIVEELGISWLPHFMTTIDSITTGPHGLNFGMGPGDYMLPLKPTEYMRRQVRLTPLVSSDALQPVFDAVPEEMLVFSSDIPHPEGRHNAITICEEQLKDVAPARAERFFAGSVDELLDL